MLCFNLFWFSMLWVSLHTRQLVSFYTYLLAFATVPLSYLMNSFTVSYILASDPMVQLPFSLLSMFITTLLTRLTWLIHTSFNLKMESESKITIFGLKMMVKSGLKNIFLKFLHAGDYFPPLHKSTQNHQFSSKNNYLPTWRDFKIIFSPSFLGKKLYFWMQIPFWG